MTTRPEVGLLRRLLAADADVARLLEKASSDLRAAWAESRGDRSLRPLADAEFVRAHRHDVAWLLAKASQSIRLGEGRRPPWMLALRADDTRVETLEAQALRERARRVEAVRPEGSEGPSAIDELEVAFREPSLETALELARAAYHLVPSSENRAYFALALLGTGNPGAAAEQFMALAHAFPGRSAPCHVLVNLGLALGQSGDVSGAAAWSERAAEREECGALGCLYAVWWSLQRNDAGQARRALRRLDERGRGIEDVMEDYGPMVRRILKEGEARISPEMIEVVRDLDMDTTPTLLRMLDEPHVS